jgi:transposase, IS30 family
VNGKYDPAKAHHKAYVRRRKAKYQGRKIVHNEGLKKEVDTRLMDDQSPEAIAGYIRKKRVLPSISKDAIYRYITSPYGRKIETHRFLRKRKRRGRRPRVLQIPDRTFISERPLYINERRRTGDAELDFIVSGKSGTGILLVVIDRKLRRCFLENILPVSIATMEKAAERIKKRYPEWRTATTDNDILLRRYTRLERSLSIRIFFCHPYHSWEKGTVENVNGVIRRDIPKGANLSRYSKYFVKRLEEKLNRRPMKCLGYKTPEEVLMIHRKRVERNKKHR